MDRSHSLISTAQSIVNQTESLIVAAAVVIRGRRLRQILHVLPIDVMEVQMLAREFFSRCDLQDNYMTLDKCAETFGISCKIAQGVYSYIVTNDVLDDVPFNYARKLALLYPSTGQRTSVIEDLQEWSRIYGQTLGKNGGLHLHTPRKSMLQLPKLYLTFENFVEAAVYLSPRASMQQRFNLAFNIFDANGDGFVDIQEIRNIMLDSLQISISSKNKTGNADSKNVENIFKREVEELINDLRAQYRSDEFNKEEFIEFARGVEFLNCFAVNKHWLRDILGDNKDKNYLRPQDNEMKNFLETICEENETIDSEEIADIQETLRDNLIDTVEDLKTINSNKYYDQMNINRRVSTVIQRKIKALAINQMSVDEEYMQEFPHISQGLLDPNPSTAIDPNDIAALMNSPSQSSLIVANILNYLQTFIPSTHKLLEFTFVSIYILQIILSFFIINTNNSEWNLTRIIGKVCSFGLYLCLFIAPMSRYYPFITKWVSLTPNSNLANIVLYFTSRESEKINIFFAIFYSLFHVISHQINNILLVNSVSVIEYNIQSLFPISGLVMIVFGCLCIAFWKRMKFNNLFNAYTKMNILLWTVLRLIFVFAFIFHCTYHKQNMYAKHTLLYIALLPTIVIAILSLFEYIILSQKLEVELARNERPNYVLLSMKTPNNKNLKWKCGQYVCISCPAINKCEFHPFYITSSPDYSYLDISLLSCGDWTQKVWELYVSNNCHELLPLKMSGPYGVGFSPNKMNYNYDYLLIVAAGNGSVEIIASLLNFVCSNFLNNPKHPIQKIYCYWIVSADDGCYWFYKLLRDLRNMNVDKFFPCIFGTSSNSNDKYQNAFGLNFFLALRKESLQTNLITQQIKRLSAGRISTFRRPVSVFTPNSRPSRFHSPNNMSSLLKKDLNKSIEEKDSKHGLEINNNLLDENEEDIPMQSPDFRRVFNKIREELLQKHKTFGNVSCNERTPDSKKGQISINSQHSLHGIVPALVVVTNNAANANRTFQIGTFFVGNQLLETRLKHLSQQFTDEQVQFEFNSMIVGSQYANRYSD